MKVILREDIDNLGTRGDVVDVARGFARNSLIPQGLASTDTPGNRRAMSEEDVVRSRHDVMAKASAEALARDMQDLSVTVAVKVGEDDRLYGSVTSADIHKLLVAQGVKVDRRKIVVDEPIKQLGFYNVAIRLHRDVSVDVKVWVMKETGT